MTDEGQYADVDAASQVPDDEEREELLETDGPDPDQDDGGEQGVESEPPESLPLLPEAEELTEPATSSAELAAGPTDEVDTGPERDRKPWWARFFAGGGPVSARRGSHRQSSTGSPLAGYARESMREGDDGLLAEGMAREGEAPDARPLSVDDVRDLVREETAREEREMLELVRKELAQVREETARAQEETLDLVRGELDRAREDAVREAQIALAREQEERQHALLSAAWEAAEGVDLARIQSVRAESEALTGEQQRTLQDRDRPLTERLEEVDYVRARLTQLQDEIAHVEESAGHRLAGLVERTQVQNLEQQETTIAELGQELERQKAAWETLQASLPDLVRERANRVTLKSATGGAGRWAVLVALLLVVAVGVAGILLPRQGAPNSGARSLVDIAALYQAIDENEVAIRLLDEAVAAGINDVEMLSRVGQLYYELGAYESAVQVLEQVAAETGLDEELCLALATSYSEAGQHEKAIAQYQKLIELDPNDMWHYAELGHAYLRIDEYDQALAQYQKMRDVNPDQWWTDSYQADVYFRLGEYDKAIEGYHLAVDAAPSYYRTRINLGQTYAAKGDYAHAAEQFQAASEIEPDKAEAHYQLAEALMGQGNFEGAVGPYQQALELESGWTDAHLGLGKAYLNLDDCENATPHFQFVLEQDGSNAEAQEGLAACAP